MDSDGQKIDLMFNKKIKLFICDYENSVTLITEDIRIKNLYYDKNI